ncbi:MAG: hypothetical protein AAGJ82_13670 [Bacteroidota bacterium]
MLLAVPLFILLRPAGAQDDCSSVADYPAGKAWAYRWYDSAGKLTYLTAHRVRQRDTSAQLSTITVEIVNAFEDTVYQGQYQVRCTSEGLYQDLLAKLTPDMLRSLAGVDLRTEEVGWRLPLGLQPGDRIPQAYSHLTGYNNGSKLLELDLAIGPVDILTNENLTTPAGSFPCVALAYELWITQLVRKRFRLRDWFSPGVGVIRREVFDRRGKYFGYCELVEVK